MIRIHGFYTRKNLRVPNKLIHSFHLVEIWKSFVLVYFYYATFQQEQQKKNFK